MQKIMIRLLKNMGMPNVVAFNLSIPQFNDMALLYERFISTRYLMVEKTTLRNTYANQYLGKQFKRLRRYVKDGEFNKFNFLAKKIMTSYAFQIYAYNSVQPKWTSLYLRVNGRHLRYLRKLCHTLSTDLDYKRVWIDKKPGDYARPLGVPTLVWRVYLRMLTNLGEIYLDGKGLYSDFQHGGRPGKGVMTCLMEMVKGFSKFDKVYEFDLKGFFDHVSKDSVKEFFKDTLLSDLYYKLLLIRPNKFILPPEDKDIAKQKIEEVREKVKNLDNVLFGVTYDMASEIIERLERELQWLREDLLEIQDKVMKVGLENADEEIIAEGKSKAALLTAKYGELNEAQTMLDSVLKTKDFKEFTSHVMTEEERAENRDSWKDLNLPDQGIPQGTSFGPMIASTIAGYYLRGIPNLIMYVDDGMVFLNENDPSPQSKIVEALKPIKVELALEKSHLRDRSSLISEGIKFLGTRAKLGIRNFISMASETRKGIVKEFPLPNEQNYNRIIEKMYLREFITKSKFNQLKWFFEYNNSRLKELLTGESLNIAMKWGFFGNLLAESYNPLTDLKDLKNKINEGMTQAHKMQMSRNGSIGKFILEKDEYEYIDQFGNVEIVKPTLFNLSTLACDLLLQIGVKGLVRKRRTTKHELSKFEIALAKAHAEDIRLGNTNMIHEPTSQGELLSLEESPKDFSGNQRSWLNKRYKALYAAKMAERRSQITLIRWKRKP